MQPLNASSIRLNMSKAVKTVAIVSVNTMVITTGWSNIFTPATLLGIVIVIILDFIPFLRVIFVIQACSVLNADRAPRATPASRHTAPLHHEEEVGFLMHSRNVCPSAAWAFCPKPCIDQFVPTNDTFGMCPSVMNATAIPSKLFWMIVFIFMFYLYPTPCRRNPIDLSNPSSGFFRCDGSRSRKLSSRD